MTPDSPTIEVLCDQTTKDPVTLTPGGWTVFQYRRFGDVDFNRNYTEYKKGFGNVYGEFWLGLDILYNLTNLLVSGQENEMLMEMTYLDSNNQEQRIQEHVPYFRTDVEGNLEPKTSEGHKQRFRVCVLVLKNKT